MGRWPAVAVLGVRTPGVTPSLRDGSSWRAAVLYGVLTMLLAYPLWIHPASRLMSPSADTDLTKWALAWDTHAFMHQPLAFFDANIYYPQHLTLAYSESFIGSALLATPVLWLTGNPVLAFNLVALVSPMLCGLGAFLLARRLRISVPGATLAGIGFAFSPPRFVRIDLSVTYVVVHTDVYEPDQWRRIEQAIDKTPALKLEHVEGAGRIYSLPR
jgi:hypothetical protein